MLENLPSISLRKLVLETTGQDVRRCRDCAEYHAALYDRQITEKLDILLDSMIQMVL